MSAGSCGSGLLDVRIGAGVDESMGMGMGIEAVKGIRPAVRTGSSTLGRRGGGRSAGR